MIRLKLVSLQMDKQLSSVGMQKTWVVIRLKLVSLQMDKQPDTERRAAAVRCDSLKISIFANG